MFHVSHSASFVKSLAQYISKRQQGPVTLTTTKCLRWAECAEMLQKKFKEAFRLASQVQRLA